MTTFGRVRPLLSSVAATDERRSVALALFLVGMVAGVVPVLSVVADVPPAALVLVATALYALVVVALDRPFEGLVVALFAVAGFNPTAHLIVPVFTGVIVRVVDVLALSAIGVLLVRGRVEWSMTRRRGPQLVVGAFAIFVLWTALSTFVGNGPSSTQASQYAIEHARYLLVLVATALLVAEVGPTVVVAPLTVGLAGGQAFAVDEVFAGLDGYLINFGPFEGLIRAVWPSPSLGALPLEGSILYDGTIGHNRVAVGMGIAFVGLVLAASTRSRWHALLAPAALLAVVNVVASGSHAALVGLYAAVAVCVVYLAYLVTERFGPARARTLVAPIATILGTVLVLVIVLATVGGMDELLFVRTNNMTVRLQQYGAAIDLARRYPLFGIGGGWNFYLIVGMGIHNLFLANLAATGVPGFLAFLTAQAAATWLCLGHLRDRPADERWLWVGVLAAQLAFYAYVLWVVAHWWVPVHALYWILAGVVVGTAPLDPRGPGWLGGRLRGDDRRTAVGEAGE